MDVAKFKELLDSTYQWPDYYDFKFIVKADDKHLLESMLTGFTITENPSKQGNYVSVTARKLIKETQEVIDTYVMVSSIKGIMSL